MKRLALRGRVVRGDGLGRKLGFPTANLSVSRGRLPPFGVYRVLVSSPALREPRLGACNVGVRPTLGGGLGVRVEVHIPGYSGDLHGRSLELVFLGRIRAEKKFPSLGALKRQMARDIRSLFISRRRRTPPGVS